MTTALENTFFERDPTRFEELLPALIRLDRRLALAVSRARATFGAEAPGDQFRGLYITDDDVERMLAREPGMSAYHTGDLESADVHGFTNMSRADEELVAGSRLEWLATTFALSPFDIDTLVITLAPALDLRYERLYAFLQDDVSRRRPTVDLVLTLLCSTAHDRASRRRHFSADAPLVRRGLLRFSSDPARRSPLAETLEVDEQIVNFLLGHDVLDRRLSSFCQLQSNDELSAVAQPQVLEDAEAHLLREAVLHAYQSGDSLRLLFVGAEGTGKRSTALALAALCGASLLTIDASRLANHPEANALFGVAVRTGWFHNAITVILEPDSLAGDTLDALVEHCGIVVLSATSASAQVTMPRDALVVHFGIPSMERRRALWQDGLMQQSRVVRADVLDTLASRFRVTPRQIERAVAQAIVRECWHQYPRDASVAELDAESLFAAARAQCGLELEALASRTTPCHRWSDLILPEDALLQLREICDRVANREQVIESWGFGERLTRGGGVNALFSGPSGTGKTMAAEVIAGSLGVDLFRVDLAGVVSKYIGETEKNLDRVFAAAEHANGIIFFDEADALFGKRSEVHDSHDRYANIEISYLLQKMERFDGVAILATNLRGNLDDAFVRRLAFSVHFPFPDALHRERIWRGIWPSNAPVDPSLDLKLLARQFALSGGHIKNVAVAAAFLAAERGSRIELCYLLHAVRREYQKLGKTLTNVELSPFDDSAPACDAVALTFARSTAMSPGEREARPVSTEGD